MVPEIMLPNFFLIYCLYIGLFFYLFATDFLILFVSLCSEGHFTVSPLLSKHKRFHFLLSLEINRYKLWL